MARVNIYVSTDIRRVGKGDGQYIYILEAPDSQKEPRIMKESIRNVTARAAELEALIKALGRMNRPSEISIRCTDGSLAKDIREQLDIWAEHDFIGSKGEAIKDQDMWRELYKLLSGHKLLEVSCEHNTWSSWMRYELGLPNTGKPENRIGNTYDTILKIQELVESLDLSEVDESEEIANAVKNLCETFFVKFKITQNHIKGGFVMMENPQSQKRTQCSGNVKITSADKTRV